MVYLVGTSKLFTKRPLLCQWLGVDGFVACTCDVVASIPGAHFELRQLPALKELLPLDFADCTQ